MFQKIKETNKITGLYAVIASLMLSLCAHAVILYRYITAGTLFTGKGDGLAQMIPFQMYLYRKFTNLNFFYDIDFGIGGDFFRSLSYYYSTSPVTYINYILVYIGQFLFGYDTDDIDFWLRNQIFISIIKMTFIIFFTYKLMIYLKVNRYAAMTSSFLYAYSTVYFFFTFTWSFFSDVMIYLPITILGFEKLMKEKKPLLFITGIALTLHSNFYFSYYEFIFILMYFLLRLIIRQERDIIQRKNVFILSTISAVIALMIAAVGFGTGVTSYILNDRSLPPLKLNLFIDKVGFYNLFYDGYYVVIPFIAVIALCTFKFYRNDYYKLFSIITIVFLIGSLSPYFDSFFNGFSIDQRRWVYLLVFCTAVLSALYLNMLKELTMRSLMVSIIPLVIIYPWSVVGHEKFLMWLIFIPIVLILIYFYMKHLQLPIYYSLLVSIIVMNIVFVYEYMTEQMDTLHPPEVRNTAFVHSKSYNSSIQNRIIKEIKANRPPVERIDWQTSATHNTPMYQQFNGIKLYSSIFDQDIYEFYDQDMNIAMDTDSNSIYYRLGERANLYSLFNVNHSIRTTNINTLPYGFKKGNVYAERDMSKIYTVYQNQNQLPAVRVTNQIFDAQQLKSPIDREHAMLSGVVMNNEKENSLSSYDQKHLTSIKPETNLMKQSKILERGAELKNGILKVTKEQGGITFQLPKKVTDQYKDLYVTMNIELKSPSKYHYIWINEIYQARKPLDDDYRRFVPQITLKVKATDVIDLKLQPGTYVYQLKGIYGEDYKTLKKAAAHKERHKFKMDRGQMDIHLAPHQEGYAVIPAPYLKGMKAEVDGKKAEVKEGNYLMTAVKVKKDSEHIVVKYTPPFFHLYQLISLLGIIAAFFFNRYCLKKKT